MPPANIPPTPTDDELLERLRSGDEQAFEAIAARYYSGLLRYLTAHVGSADVAEDLLQDIMVRIWHRRETLAPHGELRVYLYTAARRQVLDDARGRRRAQQRNDRLSREWSDPLSDHDPFEGDIDRDRLLAAIGAAAETLPAGARDIWRLYRDHGMSYPEIAAVLGVSVSTVKTQMSRTLAKLRAVAKPFLVLLALVRL
jgi:RNA polymerase sigma-70 factor (ECF subfamily)